MKKHSTAVAANTSEAKPRPQRLLALDILRGITIAGMLLVNNPGSWGNIYAPLEHAAWHGLTPTDLVFPFFMFIMGVSTYFSLRKYDFRFSVPTMLKILRRTVVIFLIGIGIAYFGQVLRGIYNSTDATKLNDIFGVDNLRILGVMPRLALCYGIGSLLALLVKRRGLPWLIGGMLVLYSIILLCGNGLEFSRHNIIAVVDRAVLGPDHMYKDTIDGMKLAFDPEGLLSTLPAIAHMLIGFLCGGIIVNTKDNNLRINKLFIIGVILTFAGFLLDYGMPINKKIWSATYAITTCGLASSFLGLLIWIIDIKGKKGWCRFFEAYGINPLFMYVLGGVMSIVLGCIPVGEKIVDGTTKLISLKSWLYGDVLTPMCGDDKTLASLFFALLFVGFIWCFGYILYKKKIYIKI